MQRLCRPTDLEGHHNIEEVRYVKHKRIVASGSDFCLASDISVPSISAANGRV